MKKILFIIIFFVVIGGTFLVYRSSSNEAVVEESNTVIGEKEPEENTDKYPAYTGEPIIFLGNDPIIKSFPPEAVAKQKLLLSQLAESLKENPANFDGWLAVGLHKKFFNNYFGARDAWEYAKLVLSDHALSYLNLGNLYGYYLNDFKKAEDNYLLAIDHDLLNSFNSYYALANFYRDFGFKEKAIEYYKKVLEFFPEDAAVKVEIERLQVK